MLLGHRIGHLQRSLLKTQYLLTNRSLCKEANPLKLTNRKSFLERSIETLAQTFSSKLFVRKSLSPKLPLSHYFTYPYIVTIPRFIVFQTNLYYTTLHRIESP